MKRVRGAALCAVIIAGIAGVTTTAGAQSSDEKPKATDVGITAKEIHVAVDRRRRQPDRAEPVQGFEGRDGGLGEVPQQQGRRRRSRRPQGRRRLLRLEAQPERDEEREITACQNDVAAVGTSAVFLTSVDEMRNCKDSTGAVTGLPDIPFVSTALVQQCSDQSFPIAPPQVLCDTADRAPADVPGQRGARLLLPREVRQGPPRRLRLRQRLEVGARLVVRQPRRFARHRRVDQASSPTRTSTSPSRARSRSTRRSCRR